VGGKRWKRGGFKKKGEKHEGTLQPQKGLGVQTKVFTMLKEKELPPTKKKGQIHDIRVKFKRGKTPSLRIN